MDRYKEIRIIGRGNYGLAYLVRDKDTGRKLVVKKIPLGALDDKERETAVAESKLLSRISHSNIIEFVTSFLEDDTLHIVTAFCDGGDLAALIKSRREAQPTKIYLEEDIIVEIFIQLAMAVDYCHSQRIMHRDLKTGNVFISKRNVVKLGDFGIAKVLGTEIKHAQTVVGTPHFMSPEVCESKPYDFKSDVWGMGCILYELCALEHAFDAQNLLKLVCNIVQCEPPPLPDHYSDDLKELVKLLLSKDPAKRPSVRKLFLVPLIRHKLEKLAERKTLPDLPVTAPSVAIEGVPLPSSSSDAVMSPVSLHRRENSSLLKQSHVNRILMSSSGGGGNGNDGVPPLAPPPPLSAPPPPNVSSVTPPPPLPTLKRSASHGESLAAAVGGGGGTTPLSSPPPPSSGIKSINSSKPTEKKSNHHRSRSSIVFSSNNLFDNEFASSTPLPPGMSRRESPPGGNPAAAAGMLVRKDSARSRSDSMGYDDDGGQSDAVRVLDELKYRANLELDEARTHHARSNSSSGLLAFQQLSGTVSTTSTVMTSVSTTKRAGGHLRRASGGEIYSRADSSSSLRTSRELGDESL